MKNNLLTPADLLVASDGQDALPTQVAKLLAAAQVLQQSIVAQQVVVNQFENQPELYAMAVKVVEGLVSAYGSTLLQASLLDLQIVLGSELAVARYLSQTTAQIKQQATQQRLITERQSDAPAVVPDVNGTPVASPVTDTDNAGDDAATLADANVEPPDETVH